ncbi:MAG: sugar phosphate isomerase/epimerase [Clostridia bacterium]|nr:sugar phosphate isomerase/epimerase [Clostridia bacterium]
MYRLKLGTSVRVFERDGVSETFRGDLKEIKREGFYSVEATLGKVGGYGMNMERATKEVGDCLKAVLDEGLVLNSIHLPFQRFIYISSYDEGVRKWAVDEFKKLIAECDKYGPKHYVFHSKTGLEEEGLWGLRIPALIKTFRELVASTKANICMENMVGSYPKRISHMVEVLEQVDGGKCCIDTNHFLNDKVEDAVFALKKWLTTLHVSDYDGVYERHQMPKTGVNDWMKIIGALEEIGYDGVFTYELRKKEFGYSYADIRKNYEELFEEYNKNSSK